MDVETLEAIDLDVGVKIWKLIELRLVLSPIEMVFPIRSESLHVRQWSSIIPTSLVELIRKVRGFELLGEPLELAIGHRDGVWLHRRHEFVESDSRDWLVFVML